MRSRPAVSLTRAVALSAATGLALASCGVGGGTTDEATTSPSPTSTVSVPASVSMTEPGSDLSFGDSASVIFEPDQDTGTVLELTVEKVTKGSTKDFSGFILDDYTKAATPYYVEVSVTNLGASDVGGSPVPVWGVDADNTLLPAASFKTKFGKCESEPLPTPFEADGTYDTCLVYLAPNGGTLEAVSFRPVQEFDPIAWTGEIATPAPEPKPTKKPSKKPTRKQPRRR